MRKLKVFESVSADGYFTGKDGDMTWAYAHSESPEFQAFVAGNASGDATLVFGRVTYEMMVSYWPTPLAAKNAPPVAKRMNAAEKLVASRTLRDVAWENARLLDGDAVTALRALKAKAGPTLVVLGSGTLVGALLGAGLVDELQLVVKPVAIGGGRSLVEGLASPVAARRLVKARRGELVLDGDETLIRFERELRHSPARIWGAITDPAELTQWMLAAATIEPRVGGALRYVSSPTPIVWVGKVLAWEPPRVYEHEMVSEPDPRWSEHVGTERAIARWELAPIPTGTRLTVTFRGLSRRVALGFAPGTEAFLERLGALVDGAPLPDWMERFTALRGAYGWEDDG